MPSPERVPLAERALSDAWCAVLGRSAVQPSDEFFDQGDSIAALKLVAALRERGFTLRLQQLYDNPRFADATALITPVIVAAPQPHAPQPHAARRLPLLPVQDRTLDLDRLRPDHHNDSAVFAVPDGVSVEGLIEALTGLVAHHAALATRFGSAGGQRYQEVGVGVDARTLIEVAEVAPGDSEGVRAIGESVHPSLDLAAGRVFAARILTDHGTPWGVALIVHHLVCDFMSWYVLASDLALLLRLGSGSGAGAERLPAGTRYADWVQFLVAQVAEEAGYRDQLDYWLARPWTAVTGIRRRDGVPDRRLGSLRNIRSTVELGTPEGWRNATADLGPDAVVVGALNYALRTVQGSTTTVIDSVVNGRDQIAGAPDLSRTVGYFAEFAPVVTELGQAEDPVEVVRATAAQFHAAPAPRIAFGLLRNLSPDPAVRAALRNVPAADLYVNYRGSLRAAADFALPELDYWLGPFQSPEEQQGYPIRIMVDVEGGSLTSLWKFSATELDEDGVQAMIEAFEVALRSVCATAERIEAAGGPG